ncbi:MAG: hydroxyacylglutathione hydrolase family protein [Planctomycetota bacterium]
MNFIFEQIRTGGDRNFAYLVGDRKAGVAAAVDPSYAPKLTLDRAKAQGLRIELILNTHGHADHANGNAEMSRLTGAEVAAWRDSSVRPDRPLDDGDSFSIGEYEVRVLHAPGHCPDHVVFWLPEQKVALTGDHLFVGKIGGTTGESDARVEYDSLARVLAVLPDETTIWPGHDYGCRPSSTIALEKLTNPFLLAPDFDSLYRLKREWAVFKAEKGLA